MAYIREETRFELGLLHDRVSVLLAAEAFLTIAFTAAMGTAARWGDVVAPVLSVLGLVLAVLAWPGFAPPSGSPWAGPHAEPSCCSAIRRCLPRCGR